MNENNETKCATNGFGAKVIYFAIGGGIGAALALLFAPKSGKELRGDIAEAASNGYDQVRETAGRVKEQGEIYYETAREKGAEIITSAKEEISEIKDEISEGAGRLGEAVKETAERVMSAVK